MKLSILLLFVAICLAFVSGLKPTKAPAHHVSKHAVTSSHGKTTDAHELKHGKKSEKGAAAKHHTESARKGKHGSINHKIADDEQALKKTASHDEASHQSHKKSGAHQEHGAKFSEGGKEKKLSYAKGFHEKYHKNEQKKHDSFYSHGKKSADWKSFEGKNTKHDNHKVNKVIRKNKADAKSQEEHGKASTKAAKHNIEHHRAHSAENTRPTSVHGGEKQVWRKKHQKLNNKNKYKYTRHHY